jgi:hypothetical protein
MAAASAAYAADPAPADPAVTALTQPTNSVEAGVGYVTQDSFKYGQYNGLFNKGAYGIFNFDVRDQTPYDADSAFRWRVFGTNLGLDTRSAYAEAGNQGSFRISVGFDELRSNYTDSYQTPFVGNGSNFLTLPSTWLKPIVPQARERFANKEFLANLEKAAQRFEAWTERRAPGHLAAMRQMMQQARGQAAAPATR